MNRETEYSGAGVPIGYATQDMEIAVIDADGQPVRPGTIGEICVTSRYLAFGYRHRRDQTCEAFSVDAKDPTVRTYRTGDLGRLHDDGTLEHIGRVNATTKLRGQWLETDAIETALLRLPGIRQARVAVREISNNRGGIQRCHLVAYLVSDGSQHPTVGILRRSLSGLLPEQGIPTKFQWLRQFPVTENGKVDLSSLPPPSAERPCLDQAFKAPGNAAEVHIVRVWESLLGVSPIGVQDNFFELGGDSLLASEMLLHIEAFFGSTISVDSFWLHSPTIEDLAAHIRGRVERSFWESPALLQSPGRAPRGKRAIFCVHVQGGHLWPYRHLAHCFEDDRPVFGLPARGANGSGAADSTVEAIAAHCTSLIRCEQPQGPYNIVGVSSGAIFGFEVARLLVAQGERIGLLALIDEPAPRASVALEIADLIRALAERRIRHFQERLYQIVLNATGLSHRRRLNAIGESHRWALWHYRPDTHSGSYGGPLTLVRCQRESPGEPADMDWGKLTNGTVAVYELPAPSHGEIMGLPHVKDVADQLRAELDRLDTIDETLKRN